VQVLFVALEKSLSAMPVVNTAMLPTLVPAAIVKGSETVVLDDPTACEPMFTLGSGPVKLTCACAAIGDSRQARARRNKLRCNHPNRSGQRGGAKDGVIEISRVLEL
jgi:hypothetical protein